MRLKATKFADSNFCQALASILDSPEPSATASALRCLTLVNGQVCFSFLNPSVLLSTCRTRTRTAGRKEDITPFEH